jgi:hypothetical protein
MRKHSVLLTPMLASNAANAQILAEGFHGLLLNEFARKLHGGSTNAWAPIGKDGMYSAECVCFDEFSSEGLR